MANRKTKAERITELVKRIETNSTTKVRLNYQNNELITRINALDDDIQSSYNELEKELGVKK